MATVFITVLYESDLIALYIWVTLTFIKHISVFIYESVYIWSGSTITQHDRNNIVKMINKKKMVNFKFGNDMRKMRCS